MSWHPLDHTGDLGVEVSAGTLDGLFVECLRALADCITRVERVAAVEQVPVTAMAPDLERLLVEWLSEAVFRFDAENLVLSDATVAVTQSGEGWRLEGEMRGEKFEPERHGLKVQIKAVTYHQLSITEGEGGWRARVIFDI